MGLLTVSMGWGEVSLSDPFSCLLLHAVRTVVLATCPHHHPDTEPG